MSDGPLPEPEVVQRTVYRCPGCGKRFEQRGSYDVHARAVCTTISHSLACDMKGMWVRIMDTGGYGFATDVDGSHLEVRLVHRMSNRDYRGILIHTMEIHHSRLETVDVSTVREHILSMCSETIDSVMDVLNNVRVKAVKG